MNKYDGNVTALAARRAGLRQSSRIFVASLALAALMTGAASAQTTSTLWATGATVPGSGLILSGTAINPATGQPFRHLWYGDHLQGLCRVDPDVDTPGPHAINPATCMLFVFGNALKAGQLAFDPGPSAVVPGANDIYAVDLQAKNQGIFRLHFVPGGDNGQGALDMLHQEVLGGVNNGCGLPGNFPNSIAFGPDGNLYVGFKRSGNLIRVISPRTEPLPCSNVVTMGTTGDTKKDFGLGWIGHDLYGADGFSPWAIPNADQCFTAANNFTACHGTSMLVGQVNVPSAMISDQVYPALNGTRLYFGNPSTVSLVQIVPSVQVTANYASGFSFVSGLTADPSATNPGAQTLYVGDDPTNGFGIGQGRWWQVINAPPPPAPPLAPTNVTAAAGNASATVSWTPGQSGQPITSYTVTTNLVLGTGTIAAPLTVAAPATTATVTGLTNGATYNFTVVATNSVGSSPASAPSNNVTPFVPTVPSAPTNVSALAGSASATVAWTASASNGGSTITSYTVTALVGGLPSGITATVPGTATGTTVTGLTNGTTYTFTVHATNAIGNSPESLPSNAVTPSAASAPPDMAILVSGPASVNSGANAVYTITVSNLGPSSAPTVVVTLTPPASGATFLSAVPSQGACAGTTCNLGSMATGASASITVTLGNLTTTVTMKASVQAFDATGAPLTDPNPANNTASATTSITVTGTTTDIQVVGSAQNGGPAVGSADTYTWQIKNNLGTVGANNVVFTDVLPSTLMFSSVSTSLGTCTAPAPGSAGGTVTCTAPTLGGGQTMIVTINVVCPVAGTISNTGSATFTGTDTNPANNSFTVTIGVK